jgi:hypothetical protein
VTPKSVAEGEWSPEEAVEIERIEAGNPSPPSRLLTYVVTDCFACGKVTIRRTYQPIPTTCPGCGRAVVAVTVAQTD